MFSFAATQAGLDLRSWSGEFSATGIRKAPARVMPSFIRYARGPAGTDGDESYRQSLLCRLVFSPPLREESVGSTSTVPI
ncbi:hypothetical protein [Paraburkholderia sp. D1E]|uniref:hypothetical protein n=1 Tax=Paraburkholderia sp. D1E TaxID=3461398 RepID=UPI00404574FC